MKPNSKKIVLIGFYTALMVVLSLPPCTMSFSWGKITFQNLPLIIACITLGTGAGTIVGFMGSYINQMLTYGFTPTTLIWVLPHTIIGFLLGFIFETRIVKIESETKLCVCIILSMILLTILNTISMYVDSVVFGYYSFMSIFGTFIIRIMLSTVTALVYCVILPIFLKLIKKIH